MGRRLHTWFSSAMRNEAAKTGMSLVSIVVLHPDGSLRAEVIGPADAQFADKAATLGHQITDTHSYEVIVNPRRRRPASPVEGMQQTEVPDARSQTLRGGESIRS